MYRRDVSAMKIGKSGWVWAIRGSAYDRDHVTLRHPVRWRLLRRIWNVGIPYGVWGRETPF